MASQFNEFEIILICATLEYEEKRNVVFKKAPSPQALDLLAKFRPYKDIYKYFQESTMDQLEPMLYAWYKGEGFGALTEMTTLPEGDIVRFMRRVIDVLSQILHARLQTNPDDEELHNKVSAAIDSIDRGIVQVKL